MSAIKTEVIKVIDSLPEDCSYDEILKELVFDKMIKNGLENSLQNEVVSNQEMTNKIKMW